MKIKFFSNYDNSEALLKRFKNNYSIEDDYLEFTLNDDYDVAVVFNKTDEAILPGAKIFTLIQEPSWSPCHINNRFLTDSDILVIHDAKLFEKTRRIKLGGKVIESASFMWFHDHVEQEFFDFTYKVKKRKKLSMIVSSIYMSVGNYRKRIELLDKILKSDLDIDIYGRGLQIDDPRYKGELENKFTGLLPYEYSIAIENSNEKNYVTEKFIDPLLCATMPIYNGAPNISEIYTTDCYMPLNLDSLTIIDDIKEIISIKPDLVNVLAGKLVYTHEFNLYEFIKKHLC